MQSGRTIQDRDDYREVEDHIYSASTIDNITAEPFQRKRLPVDTTTEKLSPKSIPTVHQTIIKTSTPNGKFRKRNRLSKLNDTKEILAVEGSERDPVSRTSFLEMKYFSVLENNNFVNDFGNS